jgi:hypothetical protein
MFRQDFHLLEQVIGELPCSEDALQFGNALNHTVIRNNAGQSECAVKIGNFGNK